MMEEQKQNKLKDKNGDQCTLEKIMMIKMLRIFK